MTDHFKIALIGGSGFIGTKCAGLLWQGGHFVTIADTVPSKAYPDSNKHADVRNKDSLRSALQGVDVIINLAAMHRDDVRPVSLYDEVNVQGAQNICDVARELSIQKIIFTSSAAVYGHGHGEVDENAPHNPIGDYGRTKSEAETIFKNWQAEDPLRTLVIVRPTVVFGPENRGNVHVLMDQIARGRFVMIGDGLNKKSMAYVDNVAAFLVYSLNMGAGVHVYNYVDKPDVTMNELVSLIRQKLNKSPSVALHVPLSLGLIAGGFFDIVARLTKKQLPISRVRVEKFCAETLFSAAKLQSSGFKPPKTLNEGLAATLDAEF